MLDFLTLGDTIMSKTVEKEEVSKSELIRQQLKSVKPSERSPKAVSEALKKKGCIVTPAFVSVVKAKMKKKKKSIKPQARKSHTANGLLSKDGSKSLVLAKDFLNATGGLNQAKHILEVVNKLISAS